MRSHDDLEVLNYTNDRIQRPRGPERSAERNPASGRSRVEAAARAEFETRARRPIADPEWESTKARLVEFARMLRLWHQQAMTPGHPAAAAIVTSQDLPDAA